MKNDKIIIIALAITSIVFLITTVIFASYYATLLDETSEKTEVTTLLMKSETPVFKNLEISHEGGYCIYGHCPKFYSFYEDGTFVKSNGESTIFEIKKIDRQKALDILEKLEDEDLDVIKQSKFTGECPVNYDGTKTVIKIYKNTPESETFILDSCENDFTLFSEEILEMLQNIGQNV